MKMAPLFGVFSLQREAFFYLVSLYRISRYVHVLYVVPSSFLTMEEKEKKKKGKIHFSKCPQISILNAEESRFARNCWNYFFPLDVGVVWWPLQLVLSTTHCWHFWLELLFNFSGQEVSSATKVISWLGIFLEIFTQPWQLGLPFLSRHIL